MERLLKCTAVILPSKSVEIMGVAARRSVLVPAQFFRGPEAIDQQRLAAGGVRLQAMKQLQTGGGIAIGVVGMNAERRGGEGEIVWIGQRDDIEELAIVR